MASVYFCWRGSDLVSSLLCFVVGWFDECVGVRRAHRNELLFVRMFCVEFIDFHVGGLSIVVLCVLKVKMFVAEEKYEAQDFHPVWMEKVQSLACMTFDVDACLSSLS